MELEDRVVLILKAAREISCVTPLGVGATCIYCFRKWGDRHKEDCPWLRLRRGFWPENEEVF